MKNLLDAAAETGAGDSLELHNQIACTVVLEITGTFVGTVTFKARAQQGGTLYAIEARDLSAGADATTATAAGIFRLDGSGLYEVVPDVTAYTSGSITVQGFVVAG